MQTNEGAATSQQAAPAIVVGFWLRVAADLIDALILGAIGWAIAYPLRYPISEIGSRAVWFGFAVSVLYASVLQTRFGSGQTLGKRALGIQVLRRDGSYLSPLRSVGRYLVVSFVFYNSMYGSMLELVSLKAAEVLGSAFLFALFWVFLGCFAMIPLHPLKRGLHDIISDSIVVRKGRYDADALARLENPRRVKKLLALMAALAAAACGLVIWGIVTVTQGIDMASLQSLRAVLAKDYDVTRVEISTGEHRILSVVIWVPLRVQEDDAERDRIRAAIQDRVRTDGAGLGELETVRVSISSGVRLGIVSWNVSK